MNLCCDKVEYNETVDVSFSLRQKGKMSVITLDGLQVELQEDRDQKLPIVIPPPPAIAPPAAYPTASAEL